MPVYIISDVFGNSVPHTCHKKLLAEIRDCSDQGETHDGRRKEYKLVVIPISEYAIKDMIYQERHNTVGSAKKNHTEKRTEECDSVISEIS